MKLDFVKEILITEEQIIKRIPEIRQQIIDHYDGVKGPIKVLSVLKGGRYFSKLLFDKVSDQKFQLGYISASSYVNNKKIPGNKIKIDFMDQRMYRANVLLIDDIYDSGNTLSQINTRLGLHSATVKNVVLIKRTGHHNFDVPILSYGFEVTNKDYLVGCGLDHKGQYRKLPYIASVKESK